MVSSRSLWALCLGLCAVTATAATAQADVAARARSTANVDLPARLKEVLRDPKLYEPLLRVGAQVATVCDSCHGAGGNSPTPDVPNLAGQNAVYVLEQDRQYADGERPHDFMKRIIRVMKSDEKIAIAMFYADQKVTPKAVKDPALTAKGKALYLKSCETCHEDHGRGDETMARVAGQQPVYLNQALKRYRVGTGLRLDRQMANAIKPFTDADIDAVVAYMMSMP